MLNLINLSDPQIWVAISFILFFIFFGKLIWKNFSMFLDEKIRKISEEINTANELHNEAKTLLSEEMKKFQGLEANIKSILDDGKITANNLYIESKDKINSDIKKLEKSSLEKIHFLENQVIQDLQNKITQEALILTERFLENDLDNDAHTKTINNSIEEIEKTLETNNKFIQ